MGRALAPAGARAAIALACLAAPVASEPRHEWDGSALELSRCPDADCFVVTFYNVVSLPIGPFDVTLDLDGFVVVVTYRGQYDIEPDAIAVVPPPGWAAEPAELVVEDGGSGTVVIRPVPMG